MHDIGIDTDALFRQAGLDKANLFDSNARFPYARVRELWEQAIRLSGDPCLSLRIAKFWHPSDFHALGYAWLASPTLKEALLRAARYFHIVSTDPEELYLKETINEYRFVIDTSRVQQRGMDEEYDLLVAIIVDMCRESSRTEVNPLKLQLQRAEPECTQSFQDFFKCPVEFSAKQNIIVFPKRPIDMPLPTGNPDMLRASDKIITDYLAHLRRDDIAVQVKSKLIECLSSGQPTQDSVAIALNMSARTLQRRLHQEGTSFKTLLEETRKDLSKQYIKNSNLSFNEITFMLGFSEQANFTRAFRRWTGHSPSEYRSSH
ncbi:MAG: AraC family transcriptional regulator [Gammaproteobacteria bacterium]|nr:AraC family transcriptional regulator [Gammaproteobacteria bacterium]